MKLPNMKLERVVLSGGGTGGHIFPAIAVADEIKRRYPNADIRFVGAIGKMEMEKVPAAGYPIIGLPIAGLQRKLTVKNLILPFKLLKSLFQARSILKDFNPQVVVGFGGYASGPTLKMANFLGIPTLIQEQNSFPGKTNKLLAPKAKAICTAYSGLEKYFTSSNIVETGNPVRLEVTQIEGKRAEGYSFYTLDPNKKTILIIGGSLGARTLNQAMVHHISTIESSNFQVLWQCGKLYNEQLNNELSQLNSTTIHRVQFIERMDLAYAVADLIISRAGAISVSELCLVGKPVILVPSPNVAEDHQTKNAMALVNSNAAVLVKDNEAIENMIPRAMELLEDKTICTELAANILQLGKPNATVSIVNEIEKYARS